MLIRILPIILAGFIHLFADAQIQTSQVSFSSKDTLKSFLVRKNPPYLHSVRLNHQDDRLGKKLLRGTLYASGYNIGIGVFLVVSPEYISKWDKKEKFRMESISKQYRESYTSAPVFDKDLWYVNYVGHPFQGSYYYNLMRSQNAKPVQAALFCFGQIVLWEYGWEAGMEQPSIQDLISTPIAGILMGEMSHIATIKLGKNGFRWYEVALVCLINPAYAVNNGFKFERHRHR